MKASLLILTVSTTLFAAEPSKIPGWKPPSYSNVVGYRFRLPSDDAKEPVPSGFSLLTKSGLDIKQLDTLKTKSAELTGEQVQQLTKAITSGEVTYPAACYDPHHIFVFYDADGKPTGAIEVCFSCAGVHASPPLTKPQWYRHDFIRLARLTDALGLWLEHRTAAEYEALQRERKGKGR